MKNPESFWKNSKIGKKATSSFTPYELPKNQTKKGELIFEKVGLFLIQSNPEKIESDGYIDLDKEWALSDHEKVIPIRERLGEKYTKPYCGRKAFLIKILFEKIETPTDDGITIRKVIRKLKETSNGNYVFSGQVCVFHNKKLGWMDEASEVVDGEIVTKKNSDQYNYVFLNLFAPPDLVKKKILPNIAKMLDMDPKINEVYFFGIASFLRTQPKKDADGNPTKDFWYSMNLDDVFFME